MTNVVFSIECVGLLLFADFVTLKLQSLARQLPEIKTCLDIGLLISIINNGMKSDEKIDNSFV